MAGVSATSGGPSSPPIGADGCDLWAYNESRFALAISAVRGSIPTNCQGEVIHFKFFLSSRIQLIAAQINESQRRFTDFTCACIRRVAAQISHRNRTDAGNSEDLGGVE
jgi:hypothetical protein